jgi:predicted ribosome quality control (RQC) complex YloA/Tae2 family protein
VILKRDHPGQEVPARSMQQAAAVAGHYSAYGGSDAAEVVCALVSDVRKVKGGAPGLVTIDKEYASLRVAPDPDLVRRLKK